MIAGRDRDNRPVVSPCMVAARPSSKYVSSHLDSGRPCGLLLREKELAPLSIFFGEARGDGEVT